MSAKCPKFGNGNMVYTFYNFDIKQLNTLLIQRGRGMALHTDARGYNELRPYTLQVNAAGFTVDVAPYTVTVVKEDAVLVVSCTCQASSDKLCEHGAQVLYNISEREDLRMFFDEALRRQKLQQFAAAYGLQHEYYPEHFFVLEYIDGKISMRPKTPELYPVTAESTRLLHNRLFAPQEHTVIERVQTHDLFTRAVVLKQHKYYHHLVIELYEGETTKSGKLKNPLQQVHPIEAVWKTDHALEVKFYTGISRFQNQVKEAQSAADMNALKAIVKNPCKYAFYRLNAAASENVTATSIEQVVIGQLIYHITLVVHKKGHFFEVMVQIRMNGEGYRLEQLPLEYDYFVAINNVLHLPASFQLLKVLQFFKQQQRLLIHDSKFKTFQQEILDKLEETVTIDYTYLKPATPEQLAEQALDKPFEKMIYLTESENYVLLNPVIKYGDIEIAVRTKRQIYAKDSKGELFTVKRDDMAELQFTALLMKQHPDFYEQIDNELTWFYLHKSQLLNENWFLDAFESWRNDDIAIYGFNDIKNNKLNPYKVNINIQVTSGTNWFNIDIYAGYNRRRASLKKLHKAVKNKSRYVELDDGTIGILPEEWLSKMEAIFQAGEIEDEVLTMPKICFSAVEQLYEDSMMDEQVKEELKEYSLRFSRFESITEVPVPEALAGTLRHFQWQGLNWLNFLDDFSFGGCLADDMGLGKSIQLIAFILHLRQKKGPSTHLLVVPTSLVFNWREELQKFAPSLTWYVHHGQSRDYHVKAFASYDVVITTYGTLVSDIKLLKTFGFNYVIADESQNIKNPESQRYKAIRLLQCNNRIAVTGTPVENNTFDLYGQLSFACPGLLGGKQYFKDIYALPIDKFKDSKRAAALQNIINPFMLRRTKQQVATELPDKTEMVLYCPMGEEQQKAYDAFEKDLRDYLEGKADDDMPQSTMHVLKGITKLRQICNSPVLLSEESLYGNASAKIEVLLEQLKEKTGKHKVLVFSQFVGMLDLIKDGLDKERIAYAYLTGSTANREAVVHQFRDDENTRVFLISLKAGGTGLNLTEADYVFLVDPWWNPAVENQAIDRSYRIGQKKNVIAVRLICPDTIEEKIRKLQENKKELVNELIKNDMSFFKALTRTDLLSLLK
ncbi:Superfamily II DNA or RNA helicase, SNF2 family [Filimonas lacunae]|uniref:Superfamily II DNA or RNA helicase, SNF2 family n=2 Tax=Filimonas lacunae TaxID=477680 RepID=A0A1N7RDS8_9BACT|nr:Superfamily II DNA or RNA helicase, SNF2 family [Filimonas lacunae]